MYAVVCIYICVCVCVCLIIGVSDSLIRELENGVGCGEVGGVEDFADPLIASAESQGESVGGRVAQDVSSDRF